LDALTHEQLANRLGQIRDRYRAPFIGALRTRLHAEAQAIAAELKSRGLRVPAGAGATMKPRELWR
jgi:hypothetical protein